MCLLFGSAAINLMTSLIDAVALDPGDVEDLVGDWSDDLVGSGGICVCRQLLEGLGDVEPWITMDQTDQCGVKHATSKLPGFFGEGHIPVIVIFLQRFNQAIKKLRQSGAGDLVLRGREAPALHVHDRELGREALSCVNQLICLEGVHLLQLVQLCPRLLLVPVHSMGSSPAAAVDLGWSPESKVISHCEHSRCHACSSSQEVAPTS